MEESNEMVLTERLNFLTETIEEYLKAKTFCLVRNWSTKGPETKRMAA